MAETLKILNHRDARIVLRRVATDKPVTFDELIVESGANSVSSDRWALFEGSAKSFVEHGMIAVEGAYVEGTKSELPKYGGKLSELKIDAALTTIAACNDVTALQRWIKDDPRKPVRNALIKRHEELQKPEADDSKGA